MFRPQKMKFKLRHWQIRAGFTMLSAVATLLIAAPFALGQGTTEFTLTNSGFNPQAVAPGGETSSKITIGSVNGFAGTVNLSCQVTSSQATTTSPPVCTVSPASVTPPATATANVTTTTTTTTVGYSVAISGTGPTTTYTTPAQQLTVLSVTPQFTITIETNVAPSSVVAGSGAQGIVSVNPINGYSSPKDPSDPNKKGVYLSCASISPLVTIAPVCSFSPANPEVISGSVTSTLTISTFGPVVTGASAPRRTFYALWLPLPMLMLAGIGVTLGGKRSRKAFGLLALLVISGSIVLFPACSNTSNATSTPNGTTPVNTYTFTIAGVDIDGVVSSNTNTTTTGTGTTSSGPTVSLAVTAPPKQ